MNPGGGEKPRSENTGGGTGTREEGGREGPRREGQRGGAREERQAALDFLATRRLIWKGHLSAQKENLRRRDRRLYEAVQWASEQPAPRPRSEPPGFPAAKSQGKAGGPRPPPGPPPPALQQRGAAGAQAPGQGRRQAWGTPPLPWGAQPKGGQKQTTGPVGIPKIRGL